MRISFKTTIKKALEEKTIYFYSRVDKSWRVKHGLRIAFHKSLGYFVRRSVT